MKKSLIALAAASAFAAPVAFAATANVDVYGALGISIEDNSTSGMQVTDRQSRFGIKGSEDLGGGLKAIWQIEQAISAQASGQDGVGGATLANRNSFVGVAGGFGTVLMGRHDTPYKLSTAGKLDFFADTVADVNLSEGFRRVAVNYDYGVDQKAPVANPGDLVTTLTNNVYALVDSVHDARSPSAIAYVSPDFSGVKVSVAAVTTNLEPSIARAGALSLGNLGSDSKGADAWSASVTYENGPLYLAAGWQDVDVIDSTALKLGAGYTFGDLKVGAVYEKVKNALVGHTCEVATVQGTNNSIGYSTVSACYTPAAGDTSLELADRRSWMLNAAYGMGPIVLKAQFGRAKIDDDSANSLYIPNVTTWAMGVDYNLSKRSSVYLVHRNTKLSGLADDNMGSKVSATALGLRHSF